MADKVNTGTFQLEPLELEQKEPEPKKRKWFLSGITGRWLRSTLLLVVFILFVFSAIIYIAMRQSYYSSAKQRVTSQYSSSVEAYFTNAYTSGGDEGFETAAREYVEGFTQKDQVEVWVINGDGHPLVSSSGFDPEDGELEDFKEAEDSDTRSAIWIGKDAGGERVMSAIYLISNGEETIGAVRYIVSLNGIRTQLFLMLVALFIIFLLVLLMVLISGYLFLNSIMVPVRQINEVTKKIGSGDMDARLPKQGNDDEISELCDNINLMADELRSTDKMKNDFISTVSHEMKTPLTAIKGWAETIRGGDMDAEITKRGLDVIIEESGRLTNVVNDLLDLSKVVNGRLTLQYEKIDILGELDETIFLFKDRSMREGIELTYNAPTVPAPAEGDANRIKQVFENVLDNAFKYTNQGGSVTVAAERIPPEKEGAKGILRVYVEDTGCGISKEELPNVKKKFYKSNVSVRGSGIGLAVCDEIVRMHGGTLDIESEVGVGTCVILSFPIDYVKIETEDLIGTEEA